MALIPCPECEKQISDTAESCPDCGYKLTSEIVDSIKKDEAEKKKQQEVAADKGCVVAASIVGGITILAIIIGGIVNFLAERTFQREQAERQKEIRELIAEAERSKPKKEEIELIGHDDWVGMWSVESIGGQPPGLYLALGIESDTFISWSWTFDADGTFFSMMLQGWKEDTMRTTFSGTYHVSGDSYETRTSNALMSTAERTTVLSDKIEYQSGTWSRTEDTLNLKPQGSPTMVLRKP